MKTAPADKTFEPQYDRCLEVRDRYGLTQLGLMSNQTWQDDPKRLLFVLSRYKFVAKLLQGKRKVLEVGCADAFGTRIVRQSVPDLTATDADGLFIEDVRRRMNPEWAFATVVHDILAGPLPGPFDAAYALDLLEHIPAADEDRFMRNLRDSLTDHAVLILGSPSIHSQPYASPPSKAGHVNCKDYAGLQRLMQGYFHNVFVFSMNDEVVHTGFSPMASYFFGVGCSVRR
jgi:2-polyprenyl-3-methyl-5-hydroxy-6-metoxy-1,4-benzoquinol methylase